MSTARGRLVSLSLEKGVVAVPTEKRFRFTRVQQLILEGFEPLQAALRQVTQGLATSPAPAHSGL